jgi:peptide/nickel transport system permease protein
MSVAVIEAGSVVTDKRQTITRRLLHSPVAVLCLLYLLAIVAISIIAPIVWPHIASQHAGDLGSAGQGPSSRHWLGTDDLGRDVLDRLLVGTRVTVIAVVEAVAVAIAVGVPLGLLAGYFRGRVDRAISWAGDLVLSLPAVAILLVVLAVFPGSTGGAMVAFGMLLSPSMMRIVRSAALPIREEPYIAAARVSGLSHPRIIRRHVAPRLGGAVIIQSALVAGQALLAMSGLAFLGLIAPAPAPSWGGMIADGFTQIVQQPWLIWPPGIVVGITVLVLGLLGDTLRDATAASWAQTSGRAKKKKLSGATAPSPAKRQKSTTSTEPFPAASPALLRLDDLTISLNSSGSPKTVLDRVSFEVHPGESVALVGESGCGKTMTLLSVLGLLPAVARVESGSIWFAGQDLTELSERALRRVRGKKIGFVSQEPMVSLDPAFTVGSQLAEVVRRHHDVTRRQAKAKAVDLLRRVHLPDPAKAMSLYPHELSGGMAQRVSIARALAGSPALLVADEPTTALDVTVQAGILDLFRELQNDGMAILFVTHDWGVAADMCDRGIVMYAGEVVERAGLGPIVDEPRHPYTAALLNSDPRGAQQGSRLPTVPGTVPAVGAWPSGCRFSPRCQFATDECIAEPIPLVAISAERDSRCIHVDRLEVTA